MMRITATIGPIADMFGEDEAISLLARGNYDCIDFSMGNLVKDDSEWLQPNYRERAARIVELCKANNIAVGQAHAPFKFAWADNDVFKNIAIPRTIRSLEVASLVGAPIVVVHPIHHLLYKDYGSLELKQTIEFYRLLLPYAREYGVKIALENMFQTDYDGVATRDVYADPDEFNRAFDLLDNDPAFVACVDVGHCGLGGCCTPAEMIRRIGPERVKCLHLHDNDNVRDRHTIPLLGKLDWDDICAALKEIGYSGDLCMEVLGGYYKRFKDPELMVKAIRLASDIGRYLAGKISE